MDKQFDISSGVVSVRDLSHHTSPILRSVEASGHPVLIANHGRIQAALFATTAEELMQVYAKSDGKILLDKDRAREVARDWKGLLGPIAGLSYTSQDAVAGADDTDDFRGTVNVKQLSSRTSAVLRVVESGENLVVTKNSKVVAAIIPMDAKRLLEIGFNSSSQLAGLARDGHKKREAGETLSPADLLELIEAQRLQTS